MRGLRAASVGAVLAGAAAVYMRYRKDIRRACERMSSGRLLETACGPIQYADVGQGPVVFVVHGAAGGFDQGLLIAKQNGIEERDYRIIAPSRFGYLQTPMPTDNAGPAAQSDAHAWLLDALGVRERVAVIGTSGGAPSAMQLAIRHPDRVALLILLVPESWAPPEVRGGWRTDIAASNFILGFVFRTDFLTWAFTKLAKRNILTFMGISKRLQQRATPQEKAAAEELMRSMLPVSQRYRGILQQFVDSSTLERYALEQISVPVLIIDSRDMTSFPGSKYTAEHIPNARLMEFESGGHLLIGHSDEVSAAIRAFLRQHVGTAGTAEAA